jgi:predicted enzyme related to lactoylglutathione lyase
MNTINRLASIRIITADIHRLVDFYALITGLEPQWATPEFAELRWPTSTLAIGSTATLGPFGGDEIAQAAANRTVIIEFQVADCDAEYERVRASDPNVTVAQAPTTMPWGNRSALLRDPDGGLVNLFTPPPAGRHTPTRRDTESTQSLASDAQNYRPVRPAPGSLIEQRATRGMVGRSAPTAA